MKTSIMNFAKSSREVLVKNSPVILTGLAVTGLLTTVFMAVKATPKALAILEADHLERNGRMGLTNVQATKKEIVQLTWKCYIPTAVTGGITIACIVGANSINTKRNMALAGLYSLTEKSLSEYQSKVVEVIGENKAKEIKDAVVADQMISNPESKNDVVLTGKGETLCYDALSGRYFKSDRETIKQVLNDLSRNLLTETTIPLNDVYYELGLQLTKIGDMVMWHIDDGLIEPDFGSQLTDTGEPCLVLDFNVQPRYIDND